MNNVLPAHHADPPCVTKEMPLVPQNSLQLGGSAHYEAKQPNYVKISYTNSNPGKERKGNNKT